MAHITQFSGILIKIRCVGVWGGGTGGTGKGYEQSTEISIIVRSRNDVVEKFRTFQIFHHHSGIVVYREQTDGTYQVADILRPELSE